MGTPSRALELLIVLRDMDAFARWCYRIFVEVTFVVPKVWSFFLFLRNLRAMWYFKESTTNTVRLTSDRPGFVSQSELRVNLAALSTWLVAQEKINTG